MYRNRNFSQARLTLDSDLSYSGFSVTSLEALSPGVLEDALKATSLALQTVLSVIGWAIFICQAKSTFQ
jgi:hypothetical protein